MLEDLQELASSTNATPELISALVLDYIERTLPDLVADLSIPDPMPSQQRGRMEKQLIIRPGFRTLPKRQRNQIALTLEEDNLVRIMRVAQDRMVGFKKIDSTSISAGEADPSASYTSEISGFISSPKSIGNEVVILSSAENADLKSAEKTDDADLRLPSIDELPFKAARSPNQSHKKIALTFKIDRYEILEPLQGYDLRQWIALLSKGKLVKLLPSVPESLLPELEYIEIPGRDIYADLSYSSLSKGYRAIASVYRSGDPLPINVWKELRLIDALLGAIEIQERWSNLNNRRFHLISKKHTQGLRPEEEQELNQLQELASQRMDAAAPLPFATLARLEDFARKAGLDLEETQNQNREE